MVLTGTRILNTPTRTLMKARKGQNPSDRPTIRRLLSRIGVQPAATGHENPNVGMSDGLNGMIAVKAATGSGLE